MNKAESMDAITAAALSIQNPALTAVGRLFDHDLLYGAIVIALVLAAEWRNSKRLKILSAIGLAVILGMAVKQIVAEPRPCAGADWCPSDYAFPSLHALVAFTLMTGFLNKRSFAIFLLFALFVSFTRLNIGVHSFVDIAGALPIALISYYAADVAAKRVEPLWEERAGRKTREGAGKDGP